MPVLRHKKTGELFPFMPYLAAREDMELVEDEATDTRVSPEPPQQTKRRRRTSQQVEAVASDEEQDIIDLSVEKVIGLTERNES